MTKAHNDRIVQDGSDKGYSIRVGKTLPVNSANLAYVSSEAMAPEKNLHINDLSTNIKENGLPLSYEKERLMFPGEDFLLRELAGNAALPSSRVALTDEFSVPKNSQEDPAPLYYKAEASGWFDAKGGLVTPYLSGYHEEPPTAQDYATVPHLAAEQLLYLGTKITVTNLDGTPIHTKHRYKIHLTRAEGVDIPANAYRVGVYTNFRGSAEDSYLLRYERYNEDGTHTSDHTEVLNAYAFFEQVDKERLDAIAENPKLGEQWRSELNDKEYAIQEVDGDNYEIYAPSQVLVANAMTRPAHQFKYRTQAELKARFSNSNPGVLNIGIAFLNNSVMNVEDASGVLKKIFEDESKPPYLDFVNPHPPQKSLLKENPKYWGVDLAMPVEKWNDYDLVIITGYGYYNMSPYNDAIRNFLSNGGKVWVDNAGELGKSLSFKSDAGAETFLNTVGFSKTQNASGFKAAETTAAAQEMLNRLYILGGNQGEFQAGYQKNGVSVGPLITFGAQESLSNWEQIVTYSTKTPALMVTKQRPGTIYERGRLLVSNCGIFRALAYNDEDNMKLVLNVLLSLAETKWFAGPWQQEYVYHRDNLFKEEYKGPEGRALYVDERSDHDASQVVAKKRLANNTRTALLPYLPEPFFSATGQYKVEVASNNQVQVTNPSAEVGSYDNTEQIPRDRWLGTTADAIPGWSTKHFAGATPEFTHITSSTQRGDKALKLVVSEGVTGSHAFWSNTVSQLVGGTYRAKAWVKAEQVAGVDTNGASIGVYKENGELIGRGTPLIGTMDWVQLSVSFNLTSPQNVEVRIGFVDGNGTGTLTIDLLEIESIGSVYMTPANDGNRALYAYAVKPQGETFDLRAQGFSTADVTTYDPEIPVTYTIRSFVYTWDNYAGRYMKLYGNAVTETRTIRRSDGIVSFGSLSTMLPALNAGAQWADRNDVYYEVFIGAEGSAQVESRFVNLEIYDADSGRYFFNKNGEVIIRYMDLFYFGENRNILLQARTNYYTIRATKRRYGVMVEAENRIALAHPATLDNRSSWFLRVQNGSFTKRSLNYNDIKELIGYDNRYYAFQQRLFGVHDYQLPEFNRQVFQPSMGYKRINEEIAEYVNDTTIRVQNAPLLVKRGEAHKELLATAGETRQVFKAQQGEWLTSEAPKVYVDEDMNGTEVEWLTGFDIDFRNGLVIFEEPVNGIVKADYAYNNLEVWKRTYNNVRIRQAEMTTADRRTFHSKHRNWLPFPNPVVSIVPYYGGREKIAAPSTYTIDYLNGVVTFKEDVADIVKVSYNYSKDRALQVRDYDMQNGLLYLSESIDFKDELYVRYYYEERFLEYRGYYDEDLRTFIHLDLNPSEGHYVTMPVVRTEDFTGVAFTSWEMVPTAKLMNKEVYVYLLPYRNSFGEVNEHTVRHCYSLSEWQSIQKTNPAAMLLGTVHVREHTQVQDTVVMDTRQRGGGLKAAISETDMAKTQPLSSSYWDMATWDGVAYSKNGVVILEVPRSVLKTHGGQFDEKQVEDMVRKYIAYGVYPIIEYI